MKFITCLLLLSYTSILTSCKDKSKEDLYNKMIKSDVPKFLKLLPALQKENMGLAFDHMKQQLNYISEVPASRGTLQAASPVRPGNSRSDGNISLMAGPINYDITDSAFAINLIFFPPPRDTLVIINAITSVLSAPSDIDPREGPSWNIGKWILRFKKPNVLNYYSQY